MIVEVFHRFNNKTAALNIFRVWLKDPTLTELPPDAVVHDDDLGVDIYVNLDVVFGTGEVYGTNEPNTKRAGYHVNLRLVMPDGTALPPQLDRFMVAPQHPACVFG